MADRRMAYLAIAVIMVLLVVPAASAVGSGAAMGRDAGGPPAEERGAIGTPVAGPGVQASPALSGRPTETGRELAVTSSPAKPVAAATTAIAVATTGAAPAGSREQSAGSGGNGDREAGDAGPAARPTTPPSASRAAGGDGAKVAGEDAPAPGRSPTPVATAATAGPTHARTGSPGTGQGPRDDVTPTTAPAKTGAIRPAGNGLSDEASPNEGDNGGTGHTECRDVGHTARRRQ